MFRGRRISSFCYCQYRDYVALDDRMINEFRAVDRMRIGKGNLNIRRDPVSVHFFFHKSHITSHRISPGSIGAEYGKVGHARRILGTRQCTCGHVIDNLRCLLSYEIHSFSNKQ
jgi:hypothetical protein